MDGRIRIFTDGACSGNPGPGGWGAIVVTPDAHVKELGGGQVATTNNRMEMMGAISALKHVSAIDAPVDLYTDSTYVIHGVTRWVHGWKRNGWTKSGGGAVVNRDLWETLDALTAARKKTGITWNYVRGHSGNPGNERVDVISVCYAKGEWVELYDGPLSGYDVDVTQIHTATPEGEPGGGDSGAKPKASGKPVYLSFVDGALQRHATWKECEARVKGKSNAKYRKVTSPTEEALVLKGWGVPSA